MAATDSVERGYERILNEIVNVTLEAKGIELSERDYNRVNGLLEEIQSRASMASTFLKSRVKSDDVLLKEE